MIPQSLQQVLASLCDGCEEGVQLLAVRLLPDSAGGSTSNKAPERTRHPPREGGMLLPQRGKEGTLPRRYWLTSLGQRIGLREQYTRAVGKLPFKNQWVHSLPNELLMNSTQPDLAGLHVRHLTFHSKLET